MRRLPWSVEVDVMLTGAHATNAVIVFSSVAEDDALPASAVSRVQSGEDRTLHLDADARTNAMLEGNCG